MAYELKKPVFEDKSQSLDCRASGCPMRWSVDTEGRHKLCSYHAWVDPQQWPEITQRLQMDGPWLLEPKPFLDDAPKQPGMKAWAYKMRDHHAAGGRLSRYQVQCYQEALGRVAE